MEGSGDEQQDLRPTSPVRHQIEAYNVRNDVIHAYNSITAAQFPDVLAHLMTTFEDLLDGLRTGKQKLEAVKAAVEELHFESEAVREVAMGMVEPLVGVIVRASKGALALNKHVGSSVGGCFRKKRKERRRSTSRERRRD